MARPDEHFEQARQNRAFAEHLLATYPSNLVFLQWAVTAAFYAALHCMSGYLVQQGVQVFNHEARDAALARLTSSGAIPFAVYDAYVKLKRRSTGPATASNAAMMGPVVAGDRPRGQPGSVLDLDSVSAPDRC